MANDTKGAIQSVDRLFDIIEIMSDYTHGITITELAEKAKLSPSTVHRFLSALTARGYAHKAAETGKYRMTARMYEIGAKVIPGLNILSVATPYLERLSEQAQESVHLVTRDEDEVLYLFKQDVYSSSINMGSRVGLRNPMYCTGVGKSILAFLPEEEVKRIWDKTEIIQYTQSTIVDYPSFCEELKSIRENGYAIDDQEHELGIRCLAVPLFDCNNKPFGAISISGMTSRMGSSKIERLIPVIKKASMEISELYGATE